MNNPIDRMSPLLKFLHLAVLAGFAIAQPLYDLLAAQAEFFVVRQSPRMDIFLTVLLVSIVVPLGLLLPTLIPGTVSKAAQRLTFLFAVAALVFCFALVAIRQNDLASGYLAFAISAVIAILATALYRSATGVRTLVTFMSPAILVFPIVFLMSGNISVLRQPPELAVQGASGIAAADDGQYPPVIMILFDELSLNALLGSDGKLDVVRYPNFAALAGTSTWYSNATTVAPVTNYAVPAILSGRYPDNEALPVAAKYPQTLFSLLRGTHTLNIRETVTRLCPTQSCRPGAWSPLETTGQLVLDLAAVYGHMALPAQFSHWLPPLGHKWGGFVKAGNTQAIKDEYRALESEVRDALAENLASDRTRDLERFLDGIVPQGEGKPPMHFLHLLVPHRPWSYYPSGVMYTGSEGGRVTGMDRADVYWEANQDLVDQAYQRYLMQVGLVDKWLGRIVQKLEASDLFEDALFIVASDHGASFVAGDAYRKLTSSNYESVLPVPLFIKLPGQDVGRIDDSNVEITDILPTIAGLLGVELTEAVDGLPIGSPAVAKRNTKRMYDFYSRWEHKPVDVDAELSGRAAFIARRVALFGEGAEGSLYAFGPHRDIVGRAVSGFEVVPADASVSIDQASLLQEVDVNSGYLPGLVTGSLLGAAEPLSQWLVLALNGVIAASAPVYQDAAGRWAYAGLLPESGFTAGHNVVELFFVERGEDAVVLGAAGSSGASPFWLEKTDSGEVVAYEGTRSTLPIVPLAVHGYVDTSLTQERSLKVSGWAIDPQSKEAVVRLLVFANGRGVSMASHNRLARPDILQHHGVAGAGFSVLLPRTLLDDNDRLEIRVIGVNADGSAGELGYIERFEWRPGRD